METSILTARSKNTRIFATTLTGLPLLGLLALSLPAGAQEVSRVYPRYAIAGQETRFTVEGQKLPVGTSAVLGMKYAFAKPAECGNARRDRPSTSSRYHFACVLHADADSARLAILHKPKPKVSNKLWEGVIQVLPAAPAIQAVTLIHDISRGVARIGCPAPGPCITSVGEARAGQAVLVEISGKNLPFTLHPSLLDCKAEATATAQKNTSLRSFTCTLPRSGEQVLRVLSAPPDEGGQELLAAPIAL